MKYGAAYKTCLTLSFIPFLIAAKAASAQWAGLLQITPGNSASSPIDVKYTISPNTKNCNLTVDTTNTGGMYAWLVRADRSLSPREQELRNYLWEIPMELVPAEPKWVEYPAQAPIRSIIQQVPKSRYRKMADAATLEKEHSEPHEEFHTVYGIVLPKIATMNAYLYIDHPSAILDGGWFYSVDLAAFCAKRDDIH